MSNLQQLLRPRVKSTAVGWVCAAVLFAASISIGAAAYRQHTIAKAQVSERVRRQESAERKSVLVAKPVTVEEERQWQDLKAERDFPWERLFQAVEAAAMADIELLDFSPDKVHRRIILRGEARDMAALISYLDLLTAQPQLRGIYLARQQAVEREKLSTIEFEIRGLMN